MDRCVRTTATYQFGAADRVASGTLTTMTLAVARVTGTETVSGAEMAVVVVAVAAAAAADATPAELLLSLSVEPPIEGWHGTCRVTGSVGVMRDDTPDAMDVGTVTAAGPAAAAVVVAKLALGWTGRARKMRAVDQLYTAATGVHGRHSTATSTVMGDPHRPVGARPVLKLACMTVGWVRGRRLASLVSGQAGPTWSGGWDCRCSGQGRQCLWPGGRWVSAWSWASSMYPVV